MNNLELERLERILSSPRLKKSYDYEIEVIGDNEFMITLIVDETFSVKKWHNLMGVLQLYFDVDSNIKIENRFGYLRYLKLKVTPVWWPEN